MATDDTDPRPPAPTTDRRRFLAGAGLAAGAAWAVPTVLSVPAAAAATPVAGSTALAVGQGVLANAWVTTDSGATWTTTASQIPGGAQALATDGGGRWVAVGAGSAHWSDDDGATWTAATVPAGFDGRGVAVQTAVGPTEWITVGQGTSRVYTSPDGTAWTAQAGVTDALSAVAVDGVGYVLAVGPGAADDRLAGTWGGLSPPAGFGGSSVATDGTGTFLVVGPGGAWRFATCPGPGCGWATLTVPADWDANAVATDGAGTWVAVGRDATNTADGRAWASTDDGDTWTAAAGPYPNTPAETVATDATGAWVAHGGPPTPGTWTSSDGGATWQPATTAVTATATATAFDRQLP